MFALLVCLLAMSLLFPLTARADTGDDSVWSQLMDGSISGRARLYDYRHRDFENAPYPNQAQGSAHDDQATYFGGDVLLRTGSVAGFSGGLSVFTEQRLIHYAEPDAEVRPIWKFSGDKRGFSIGDDIGVRSGFGGRNTFYEDRLCLVYTF